jgi:hypothetical protein
MSFESFTGPAFLGLPDLARAFAKVRTQRTWGACLVSSVKSDRHLHVLPHDVLADLPVFSMSTVSAYENITPLPTTGSVGLPKCRNEWVSLGVNRAVRSWAAESKEKAILFF